MRVWSEWSYMQSQHHVLSLRQACANLDSAGRRNLVCEVSGIEVALEATDGNEELCVLNLFLDLWTTDRPNVDLIPDPAQ
jgi:hypothetical protein